MKRLDETRAIRQKYVDKYRVILDLPGRIPDEEQEKLREYTIIIEALDESIEDLEKILKK